MTYEEASGFLKTSEQYGSILGLESMRILLDRLGNPQVVGGAFRDGIPEGDPSLVFVVSGHRFVFISN